MRILKWVFWIFIICAVIIILTSWGEKPPEEWTTYKIEAGDTLWEICRERYGDGSDIRYNIYYIEEKNGLSAGNLQPGDVILIPR